MLSSIRKLLEMIKFSHTVFALPFALLSASLAWCDKPFHWLDLLGLLLCMVFARSAAMAFNRIADRHFDGLNPRTAKRHLPAGEIRLASVWLFTIVSAAGFVASTAIFLVHENPWPLYLAAPVLAFLMGYSYTKRFTALSHFWLGISLCLAPIAAWIAIRGMEVLTVPVILGGAVLCWVAGFDIIYACQDVEFDRQIGLFSIPARLGVGPALRIASLWHLAMVGLLVLLGWLSPHLGPIYFVGVGLVLMLLAYEHAIVRPDDLSRVNQAFFVVNGVISIGLLGAVWIQLAVR